MAFEADFKSMMPHSVRVFTRSGLTANGVPAYNTGVLLSGRIVSVVRMVRDYRGQERVSNTTVYLNSSLDIGPEDKIVLPSGYTPTNMALLSVSRYPDQDGIHHTVLYG